MRFAGIDIGSRTIELVVLKDREITRQGKAIRGSIRWPGPWN